MIVNAQIPIDELSEELREARNKDGKRFRKSHARNSNRTQAIEDLISILLITFDSMIPKKIHFSDRRCSMLVSEIEKVTKKTNKDLKS